MNPEEQLALIRQQVRDTWQRLLASVAELRHPEETGDFIDQSRRRAALAAEKRARRAAAAVVLVLCLPLLLVVLPYRGFDEPVNVTIEPGLGRRAIAARLADRGVLRWRWPFLLYSALRPGTTLKAGEYRFDTARSAVGVFSQLANGRVYFHALTIPEGWTRWEIADEVARQGLAERDAFLQATENAELIGDLAPRASDLEGYLYPDTYRISKPASAEVIVRMMVRRFREVMDGFALPTGPGKLTLHQVVTLASLVEEETGERDERALIAGVYANRLRRGMRLGCDPTVIYAERLASAGKFDGTIHQSDLDRQSPYNTYLVAGLPPGPISSPGRDALAAAIHPQQTEYLFFVADTEGGHSFARTSNEHERNVRRYREALAQRRN